MAINIMGKEEIDTAKYNSSVQELEDLQDEAVECIKNSLDLFVEIDYLYEVKNYIDQLLIDWQECEEEEEDG